MFKHMNPVRLGQRSIGKRSKQVWVRMASTLVSRGLQALPN
jgi:hypothetical protein